MYDSKKCEQCKYSSQLNQGDVCCMYIVIKQELRGCYSGEECNKFEIRTNARRARITDAGGFVYDD